MNIVDLESFKPFRNVYWSYDPIIENLQNKERIDLDQLDPEELKVLVKTLDKRFSQLWDKVIYERQKGYVQYPFMK